MIAMKAKASNNAVTNSGKKDNILLTAEKILAVVKFVRSGRYLFIKK